MAPLPAGTWHVIGDGIVYFASDITYDVIWRHGGTDTRLLELSHHFEPPAAGFDATPFEADAPGLAAAAQPGDQLILRMSATGTAGAGGTVWIPNGDGKNAHARIPSLTLPLP